MRVVLSLYVLAPWVAPLFASVVHVCRFQLQGTGSRLVPFRVWLEGAG